MGERRTHEDPPTLEIPPDGRTPRRRALETPMIGGSTTELDYEALILRDGGEMSRFFYECLPGEDEIARLHQEFHDALAMCGRGDMVVPLERFSKTLRAKCALVAQRDEVHDLSVSVNVRQGRVFIDVEPA